MTTRYASAAEFRLETNIGSDEWSDSSLEQLLDEATELIDTRTGRTWQGVQTVTDEYYDGNGETFIYLDQIDIQSVTALAIDDDADGTYTSITLDYTRFYDDIGRLELDTENSDSSQIEVDSFTKGPKTVKVSYTYGNATPTSEVKQLCMMLVEQRINPTEMGKAEVDRRLKELRRFEQIGADEM